MFAPVVVLSVVIWMHGQALANQRQHYIRETMSKALSGRSAWLLLGLAFVEVYPEVFDTMLFYVALWTQGNGIATLAGAGSACVAMAIVAWVLMGCSRQLPIARIFQYSSSLMAVLTVVLARMGISSFQRPATSASWP